MIEDLHTKSMKELREIAKGLNLEGVKAESAQALRTRITFAMTPGLLNDLNKNGTEAGRQKPLLDIAIKPKWLTAQEVVDILKPYHGKVVISFYDANGNASSGNAKTWMVKNGPAEDSGSMTMPIELIRRKAETIATARFPAKYGSGAGDLNGALSV